MAGSGVSIPRGGNLGGLFGRRNATARSHTCRHARGPAADRKPARYCWRIIPDTVSYDYGRLAEQMLGSPPSVQNRVEEVSDETSFRGGGDDLRPGWCLCPGTPRQITRGAFRLPQPEHHPGRSPGGRRPSRRHRAPRCDAAGRDRGQTHHHREPPGRQRFDRRQRRRQGGTRRLHAYLHRDHSRRRAEPRRQRRLQPDHGFRPHSSAAISSRFS